MPLFAGTYLQVSSVERFSRLMSKTTRTHVKVCLCLLGILLTFILI